MKSQTVEYTITNDAFDNKTIEAPPICLKGATRLTISLLGIDESSYKVDEIVINWGDASDLEVYKRSIIRNYKTQSIFDEVLFGKLNGSILGEYEHDFYNQFNTYEADYIVTILLQKNNGAYINIRQPVTVFWSSFYDNVGRLSILDSQVQPLSTNTTFLNLESSIDKNVYMSVLKEQSDYALVDGLTLNDGINIPNLIQQNFVRVGAPVKTTSQNLANGGSVTITGSTVTVASTETTVSSKPVTVTTAIPTNDQVTKDNNIVTAVNGNVLATTSAGSDNKTQLTGALFNSGNNQGLLNVSQPGNVTPITSTVISSGIEAITIAPIIPPVPIPDGKLYLSYYATLTDRVPTDILITTSTLTDYAVEVSFF